MKGSTDMVEVIDIDEPLEVDDEALDATPLDPDAHEEQPRSRRALRERGAGLVEYALLVSLIALVCIGAIMMLGGETNNGPRGVNRSASSIIEASN
jgi:hypothetical protein